MKITPTIRNHQLDDWRRPARQTIASVVFNDMRVTINTLIFSIILTVTVGTHAQSFDKADWNVRCWDSNKRLWVDSGVGKMTITSEKDATKITNTSGIHRHAHLVFPVRLAGDFTFTIELEGGYELGFLNREGKDEMLYVELAESKKFEVYELNRKGTRFEIKRSGRVRPLVHFRFDYSEDFLITLAIKDGESARVHSYAFKDSAR